jgi:hypothetical protein
VEQGDVDFMTRLQARTWGFRTGTGCPTLSYWSPSADKKGGVAMMIDPYSRFKEAARVLRQHWTPHFMAIKGRMDG